LRADGSHSHLGHGVILDLRRNWTEHYRLTEGVNECQALYRNRGAHAAKLNS